MKIVRIVPLLDFGGVEQRIKHTVLGFDTYSYDLLEIVVLGGEGKISQELHLMGTHPIHFHQNFKIPNLRLIYMLFQFLKNIQPDVVHTSASEANFHGLIAAKMAGVPVRIGEEIGFPNHDFKWRFVFKWVYKSATKVIAISQSVKDRIVELGEVEEEKVEVVYNPVDLGIREKEKGESGTLFCTQSGANIAISDVYNKHGEGEKPFVFVTTCRLVAVKNLDTLIKVFFELVKENQEKYLKLWILGDGPDKVNLEALVKKIGIQESVVFYGFQEDVNPFLKNSDAFVLPSFSEGFSISLVEAMLCELPCIVTNQGGPSEIVEDGKTGFLINPRQASDLKCKMLKVLKLSNEQRQLIGRMAQEAGKKYSVWNYVKKLLEVYSTP
ncbi:glycosyltransferase [Pleomorphovibrio marinus]|uniref:glycosyltransferase n=1 Tax=Pleomorphovibrio marinus TaxID=2164132 RepID=UPI000E0A96FD|nr:glycosyltransferase [Pleomorphovibrio marinus]